MRASPNLSKPCEMSRLKLRNLLLKRRLNLQTKPFFLKRQGPKWLRSMGSWQRISRESHRHLSWHRPCPCSRPIMPCSLTSSIFSMKRNFRNCLEPETSRRNLCRERRRGCVLAQCRVQTCCLRNRNRLLRQQPQDQKRHPSRWQQLP